RFTLPRLFAHVKPVPNVAKEDYLDMVRRRFSDTAIADTTRRVAFEGSARHTGFVLPILRDGLRTGTSVEGLALVEAFWARMCWGRREDGSVIEPNDPYWDILMEAAQAAREHPRAWLEQRQFYGDLVEAPCFVNAFERWLNRIWSDGCEATLQAYTAA
ncbi:MAG: mannitol dehydrogenase family protein, partial [Gammaproteobacteria bacterium]|nr:mannitol dehydrogenase family protein [Gammaproteobacteria bacterium]